MAKVKTVDDRLLALESEMTKVRVELMRLRAARDAWLQAVSKPVTVDPEPSPATEEPKVETEDPAKEPPIPLQRMSAEMVRKVAAAEGIDPGDKSRMVLISLIRDKRRNATAEPPPQV